MTDAAGHKLSPKDVRVRAAVVTAMLDVCTRTEPHEISPRLARAIMSRRPSELEVVHLEACLAGYDLGVALEAAAAAMDPEDAAAAICTMRWERMHAKFQEAHHAAVV